MNGREGLRRFSGVAAVIGVAGGIGCAVAYKGAPHHFFPAYLLATLYFFGISCGAMAFLMIHHLVDGRWGCAIRRQLEAAVRVLPFATILFLPVLLGVSQLYEWSHPDVVNADPILMSKAAYLNKEFFLWRAAAYLVILNILGWCLCGLSAKQDTGDARSTENLRTLSAPGLVVFALTMTFAAFDWLMSLEPHWFSTLYGAHVMVGQGLTALCVIALTSRWLAPRTLLGKIMGPQQFHDVGNLIFAATVLWAYMSIGQFIIIWSGNLHEETAYYMARNPPSWQMVAWILAIFHFAVPFFLLLMKSNKRRPAALAAIALLLLAVRVVDMYWLIGPTFEKTVTLTRWAYPVALIGVGGLWTAAYAAILAKRPLLPLKDPRYTEYMAGAGDNGGWGR